tara:strand:+ start:350 stop:604 length:255 start_codon:yes stop_codon:yes gene_type:complete
MKLKIIDDPNKTPTLKEAQEFVGGYVECVSFPNGDALIVNEEGKNNNLEINQDATDIWEGHFGLTDIIVGNAFLIKADSRGDSW